jgi:hypothetical protein
MSGAEIDAQLADHEARISALEQAGPPPDPGPEPPQESTSPWLPFELPPREVLAGSPRKVLPHYFVPFPRSVTSSGDYWANEWLPPGGVEGETDHRVYGGYVRDRKPYSDDRASGYQVRDKADEIRQAIAAGFDGFCVDVLQAGDGKQRWEQLLELVDACEDVGDPTFKLVLMPDGTTSATNSPETLADMIAGIADSPSLMRHDDGRLLIAPYMPERAPNNAGDGGPAAVAFWQDFALALRDHGDDPLLWFVYTNTWTDEEQAPSFDGIAYGHSRWGDRDEVACSSESDSNRGAPAYCREHFPGRLWMHPVPGSSDMRPYAGYWWESAGTGALRAGWAAAIDGEADWVQVPTWDDFSECSQIVATDGSGHAWQDIHSYYLTWYKTGAAPEIVRDGLYLIHRTQPLTGVDYTSSQSKFMPTTPKGSTTAADEVEVLAFLTAPADVTVQIGGTPTTFRDVPAGVQSRKVPVRVGDVTATATRGGQTVASVASPHEISTRQVSQDYTYKATSGLRG